MTSPRTGTVDSSSGSGPGREADAGSSKDAILGRWQTLIVEHEALRDALQESVQQPHWPGVGPCISMLRTESATVARLLALRDGNEAGTQDVEAKLAASNLTARETAWAAIKKCHGLLAMDRRFPTAKMGMAKTSQRNAKKERGGGIYYSGGRIDGVFVNAVVDDGRTWLRIMTTTEAQLVMEMAENGWEFGEEDAHGDEQSSNTDISDISIVRTTTDLIAAARANPFRGAPPSLCILLSRMDEGKTPDIDVLLGRLRRVADTFGERPRPKDEREVDGCEEPPVAVSIYPANSTFHMAAPPPLDLALRQLMPRRARRDNMRVSATTDKRPLNIDTSILIALASDITHSAVAPEPWHPQQRVVEIAQESKQPGLLLRQLLSSDGHLCGRRLVCTREAARTFRDMVKSMGQPSEQARAAVLVSEDVAQEDKAASEEEKLKLGQQRRRAFVQPYRSLSSYPDAIPDDLQLPIVVIDEDWDVPRIHRAVTDGELPAAAAAVVKEMTADSSTAATVGCGPRRVPTAVPTLAVFFFGWASGYTTVTTNHAAKSRIERLLEEFRTSPEEEEPAVWVCRTVRSLNGTNRRRPEATST